jgi:3D (Asp-Asp-Asp) domain-containing protein
VRSLVVGPTLALVILTSSPSSGPGPVLRARAAEQAAGGRHVSGPDRVCCGYPLARDSGFALHFYWLALEDRLQLEDEDVSIYSSDGLFMGAHPASFVRSLLMEGSGVLADGRLINYSGPCRFGVGTCYEPLDQGEFPFGRGAAHRALIPFKSVAVDPRVIAIGEPLYIPELDGVVMPDGIRHDGCVRADDTGGNIKWREMDFFVVSHENFRQLRTTMGGTARVSPQVEHPRCDYMRVE